MAGLCLFPFFRLKREGQDNLPKKQGFILLPKHQRWEDIPFIGIATPRPISFIAKYELFRNPISGWFLSALGGIPLNRSRPLESRGSLKSMMAFLEEGEGIVIFPEGTYYRNKMGLGRKGLIRMVRSRTRVPFIPVGIHYGWEGGRTTVQIKYGRPLYDDSTMDTNDLLRRIMDQIADLSGLKESL